MQNTGLGLYIYCQKIHFYLCNGPAYSMFFAEMNGNDSDVKDLEDTASDGGDLRSISEEDSSHEESDALNLSATPTYNGIDTPPSEKMHSHGVSTSGPAAMASVQAALAALQAGQMSLNQVFLKSICCRLWLFTKYNVMSRPKMLCNGN